MPELSARARQGADSSLAHPDEDAALVERLLAGDEAAFNGLVEQYHGRLLRLAQVFVSDRATAEEVVQDTWLAVLTGLRSFEGRSALTPQCIQFRSTKMVVLPWVGADDAGGGQGSEL